MPPSSSCPYGGDCSRSCFGGAVAWLNSWVLPIHCEASVSPSWSVYSSSSSSGTTWVSWFLTIRRGAICKFVLDLVACVLHGVTAAGAQKRQTRNQQKEIKQSQQREVRSFQGKATTFWEREKRENIESSSVWKFCCQVVIIYSFFRHQRNNFSKLCGVCKRFGLLTLFFIFIIITKKKSIRRWAIWFSWWVKVTVLYFVFFSFLFFSQSRHLSLCSFFFFSLKYLYEFVYILSYCYNKFHNIFIIIEVLSSYGLK